MARCGAWGIHNFLTDTELMFSIWWIFGALPKHTSTSEQVREATRPTPEFSGAKEKLGVAQVKLTPDVTDSLKQTSINQCPHQGLLCLSGRK